MIDHDTLKYRTMVVWGYQKSRCPIVRAYFLTAFLNFSRKVSPKGSKITVFPGLNRKFEKSVFLTFVLMLVIYWALPRLIPPKRTFSKTGPGHHYHEHFPRIKLAPESLFHTHWHQEKLDWIQVIRFWCTALGHALYKNYSKTTLNQSERYETTFIFFVEKFPKKCV